MLQALFRILALARKELVTMLRDAGTRKILVVPILVQSILFGYGATFNLERVPWTYFDASGGPAAASFLRAVDRNGVFELTRRATSLPSLEDAINEGDALVAVYLGPDFEKTRRVFLLTDARNSTTAGVAAGYVSQIAAAQNAELDLTPVTVLERFRYNENLVTRYNVMPGLILTLTMLQVLLLAGLTVAREREEGTFDMMLMTPASTFEIYVGKALPVILVALLQATLIFCVARFWFEIPFAGAFSTLIAAAALFATSVVGLGLAVSAVAKTEQQAVVCAFLLLLPSVILSGLMTPVSAMPEWLQTLTLANPLRPAIDAVKRIYLEGASFAEIAPLLLPSVIVFFVATPVALRLFRSRMR